MNTEKKYRQALDTLFSFVDFSLTHQEQIAPERFELARMFQLMALIGNPQQAYPAIHIAGTKGKGSVAAHCAAALQAAGHRAGLYTSPHLADFRERIQVDGEMIPKTAFIEGIGVLKAVIPQLPGVTSYELQTALAFWYFAEAGVQVAVVEVGMGGRLDSTNILTPLVSVITNISLDHTAILGDTLAEIAGEKGGIIKTGVPVVSAPQQTEAMAVLREIAAMKAAALTVVGEELDFQRTASSLAGQEFVVDGRQLRTRLAGLHQVENAVTAYAALRIADQAGIPVPEAALRAGFRSVSWPGRFEVFSGEPMVVLDGAHNRASARRLAETVKEYFAGKKLVIVFGASEDKDIAGMFEELLPLASGLLLVRADHPRAAKLAFLKALAGEHGCPVVAAEADLTLETARAIAGLDGVVLVTGSLYLVGEFRPGLLQK